MAKIDLSVKVTGIEEIERKLKAMPAKLQRRVFRAAGRAGAAVFREGARRRVTIESGSLKKLIAVKEGDPKKYGGAVVFSVHIARGSFLAVRRKGKLKFRKLKGAVLRSMPGKVTPRLYAHLVEFGTAPHALGAGSRLHPHKVKGERDKNRIGPQEGALHPGAKAKPFFRPTRDEDKGKAFAATAAKGKEAFEKAASELAR